MFHEDTLTAGGFCNALHTAGELKHDDVIGEAITEEEEESMRSTFVELITGTEAHGGDSRFPGSQPVSLARSNLGMLNEQRYMVTWKVNNLIVYKHVMSAVPRFTFFDLSTDDSNRSFGK